MTGYKIVNLGLFVDELGEDTAKGILSAFSCPMNEDVECFLRIKAIDFARQGWAQTHLVFASHKEKPVLIGYFALANKYIRISSKSLISKTLRRRILKFSTHDNDLKAYCLSAPLIAQLGKNYMNGYNTLISGEELLSMAINKIAKIQFELGGRFAYVECEDKEKLISFYANNGFCEFDRRSLDRDETEISGDYLVQMIKYIHK